MFTRERLLRYGAAVVFSACSAIAGLYLQSLFGYRFPLITFYPAVMATAWLGGLWPGIVATMASALAVEFIWLAPLRAAALDNPGDGVALLLFVMIGILISGFSESLHRSVAQEQSARTRAEDANRHKDQFLAMVLHELRTPLNAVIGWADVLKQTARLDDQQARAVDSIRRNAQRLAQTVNDLLDTAGIWSGKLQLTYRLVDVAESIRLTLEGLQPAAAAKRILLSFDPHQPAARIEVDASRLEQIVSNLVSNAIKFTPEGGAVRVATREENGFLEITVRDTGEGISPESLETIFEVFHQAEGSLTRQHGGLGLGLSIVKALTKAHGGDVTAASPGRNRGAMFTVRIPSRNPFAQSTNASVSGTKGFSADLTGLRVLVVDDDEDARKLMANCLKQAEAVVWTADSTREADIVLARERPDILLVDLAMPGEDGLTFIRRLRTSMNAELASIPAVAVTAFARDADRKSTRQAGFQRHITKPVDAQALLDTVADLTRDVAADVGLRRA